LLAAISVLITWLMTDEIESGKLRLAKVNDEVK